MIIRLTIQWVAEAVQGRVKQGDPKGEYHGISTDSRSLQTGEIFWALRGDKFDGHDFIPEVVKKGASGIVVEAGASVSLNKEGLTIIEVEDTLCALGELAAQYRRLHGIPIVAVTGSNGKTTTKEMIAAILAVRKRVLKNQGNLNNLIGLPLSMMKLSSEHEVGVMELGMNKSGEIARLTEVVNPQAGLITNIGPVHLEYLKTVEKVAEAKGELFQKMSPDATAIVNKDDPWVNKKAKNFSGKKISIGIKEPAEVRAEKITSGAEGINIDLRIEGKTLPVFLPMIGTHNVMNALAAAGAVTALGEDPEIIPEGLKKFTNLNLRQQIFKLPNGITIINDAYNANPVSMKKGLETFSQLKGSSRGVVVLGDMLELGTQTKVLHRELGEAAAKFQAGILLLMGDYSPQVREGAISGGLPPHYIFVGKTHQELAGFLEGALEPGDWVLVKGSRKMEMEKVVKDLMMKGGGKN